MSWIRNDSNFLFTSVFPTLDDALVLRYQNLVSNIKILAKFLKIRQNFEIVLVLILKPVWETLINAFNPWKRIWNVLFRDVKGILKLVLVKWFQWENVTKYKETDIFQKLKKKSKEILWLWMPGCVLVLQYKYHIFVNMKKVLMMMMALKISTASEQESFLMYWCLIYCESNERLVISF